MTSEDFKDKNPKDYILIKGAKINNLKNVSVAIPRNKLVVLTGLSGSGKSSLAFDTLYAEGQRRYVESLSSYARQFLGRMSKPPVDYIKGIAPAIAIEQKVNTRNPRSTVGTSTEIYEYIKLLYSRIGKTISPVSGRQVVRHSVTDVVNEFAKFEDKQLVFILCPIIVNKDRNIRTHLEVLMQQGYSRIVIDDKIIKISETEKEKVSDLKKSFLLIDRIINESNSEEILSRIADSVEIAFFEGRGSCILRAFDNDNYKDIEFSNKFEADGISFEEPSPNFFAFNNPYGACKRCEGFGHIIGIDEDLVIPDKSLSVAEEAIACWKGEKMSWFKDELIKSAHKFGFPVYKPIYELTEEQYKLIWEGNKYFEGINEFFKMVESQSFKIQYRILMSRYRGKTLCPECKGTRLRLDAQYVKIEKKSIVDLVLMPINKVLDFFNSLKLSKNDFKIAERLIVEITTRLQILCDLGLPYLTLNRLSNTLSGGESQRINLATSLGSSLIGSMYILDEPSIGLHPRDTFLLVKVLKQLRNIGNTVIVVEHEEDIIKSADYIIDMGLYAGNRGGEVVCSGNIDEIIENKDSLTGKYLSHKMSISLPKSYRKWKDYIEILGGKENNLKNISVKIPLNVFTVITGVSGSGKSTLIKDILYPALKKIYGGYQGKTGNFDKISGDYKSISEIEFIDQNPIGRSSRSNPATYVKAFDDIRHLMSQQSLAKVRHFTPGFFSFNVPGGRCEECEGNGIITVEMQFMADIHLKCENCNGKRYKPETLEVTFENKNISEILDLTIEESIEFFSKATHFKDICNRIVAKLIPLADVGLGYLKLGQSSDSFSGGEAQRLKLASYLIKGTNLSPTMFVFDEPSTGLHHHDIAVLLKSFNSLMSNGHTLVVIEHNPEIIKTADWVIDLGPEGGEQGGYVVFEGTPKQLTECEKSYTGKFLKERVSLMD